MVPYFDVNLSMFCLWGKRGRGGEREEGRGRNEREGGREETGIRGREIEGEGER